MKAADIIEEKAPVHPTEVIVCVGSNVPQCHAEMELACRWLGEVIDNLHITPPYLTAPEGPCPGSAPYLNAVARGTTTHPSGELSAMMKEYESSRGRLPEHKKIGRIIIDIDVVKYGDTVVSPDEFASDYFRTGLSRL